MRRDRPPACGAINVCSAPGVGSCFEVWLRCIAASARVPHDKLSNLSLGCGETVLVVDDANERLLADEEMLAALGYEPVGFDRASDALAACRTVQQRFDASIIGHLAPGNSALNLATALRETVPDLPILLATASADEIGADSLAAAGISEVVHRPLISAEIAWALARSLQFEKTRSAGYIRNAIRDY